LFSTSDGTITKWYGRADISPDWIYQVGRPIGGYTPGTQVIAGDFNGDGISDIVLFSTSDGTITKWYGTSGFGPDWLYQLGRGIGNYLRGTYVLPGDFNGDSIADIVLFSTSDGTITKWYGTSGFGPDWLYQLGRGIGGYLPETQVISGVVRR